MARRKGLTADYSIATVSVTLVLLLLGVVGYILINAYSSTSAVRSELRFSVMLSDTVTSDQRNAIEKRMGMHPAIATWRYISADEAARDFQAYIGTDFVDFLGENPLPASYELTLSPGYTDTPQLTALERECNTWSGVEEVVYQQKIVEAVMRNLNRLNIILLGLGGFLLIVTVMLISNTLRLAVASRRQAIATMKLVGATPAFIRRPFVLRSFTQGVVAGVLASVLLYLFADGLSEVMPDVKLMVDNETFALLASAMILVGVLICTTFTALAVNRYVRLTD
ncbi:MAG TPA: permease-like cell division protein FtsX [Candidatus Rikenella faecigallinarum]|uniref:Cell division protein FtsX n=1 Tax=Candidatus Rikenella faecigallinarum TaxID=2838745 RepID=A0A9D1QBG2_9BACT|nr:permease-like cell division protein FtsX [Candidatus Rikenella faecigallinarum]